MLTLWAVNNIILGRYRCVKTKKDKCRGTIGRADGQSLKKIWHQNRRYWNHLVGPWPHTAYAPMLRQFPEANIDMRLLNMEWIQQQLNNVHSKYFEDNPVTLFVIVENKFLRPRRRVRKHRIVSYMILPIRSSSPVATV